MDKFIKDKIKVTCDNLYNDFTQTLLKVPSLKYISTDYKNPQEIPVVSENWDILKRGDGLNENDKHFWFHTKITTPPCEENKEYAIKITTASDSIAGDLKPQGLLYLNGEIAQGADINHTTVLLEGDKEYDILLYFYTGMMDCNVEPFMSLESYEIRVKKLYYDLKVPYDAAMCLKEDDYSHIKIIKHLEQACNLIDFREIGSKEYYDSIQKADEYIIKEFYEKECGNCDAVVNST